MNYSSFGLWYSFMLLGLLMYSVIIRMVQQLVVVFSDCSSGRFFMLQLWLLVWVLLCVSIVCSLVQCLSSVSERKMNMLKVSSQNDSFVLMVMVLLMMCRVQRLVSSIMLSMMMCFRCNEQVMVSVQQFVSIVVNVGLQVSVMVSLYSVSSGFVIRLCSSGK